MSSRMALKKKEDYVIASTVHPYASFQKRKWKKKDMESTWNFCLKNKSPADIKIIVGIPVYTKRGYPQDYRFWNIDGLKFRKTKKPVSKLRPTFPFFLFVRLLLWFFQRYFTEFFHCFFDFQWSFTGTSSCSFVTIFNLSICIFVELSYQSSNLFY